MKNLFFVLAFMLVGTFAYANTSDVKTVNENVTVENVMTIDYQTFINKVKSGDIVIRQVLLRENFDFIYNDSCGGSWHVTGSGFSTEEVIQILLAFDEAICG